MKHSWLRSITLSAVLGGSLLGCEVSQKLGDQPGSEAGANSSLGGASSMGGDGATMNGGANSMGSAATNGGAGAMGVGGQGQGGASYVSTPPSGLGGQSVIGQDFGGTTARGGSSQGPEYGDSVVTHLTSDPIDAGDAMQMVYRVTWSNGEQQDYVFATSTGSNVVVSGCGGVWSPPYYVWGAQFDEPYALSISLTRQGATATLRDSANQELALVGSMELLDGPESGCCSLASANFRFHGIDDASILVEGHFTARLAHLVLLC